mgnify:CR=1 FL=1
MQTIVITGSTRGIGKGLAREFLKLGHRVVLTGRSQAAVDAAVAELASPEVLGCVCDVRDMASLEAVWTAAVARFGRVDIWISNAAVATDRALLGDLPAEQIVATIETNLVAALVQIETAIEMFKDAGGGHLVLISSVLGNKGVPGIKAAYAASKAGVSSLGESLRAEYPNGPIKVTVLEPGYIESEMTARSASTSPNTASRSTESSASPSSTTTPISTRS